MRQGRASRLGWVKRVVLVLLAVLGLIAVIVAQGVVREKMEDGDTLTIAEADLAGVRGLPVMWSPVESGAPAIYDFAEKQLLSSTAAYRRAMRVAEVLIQLGELDPGRYEYDSILEPEDLATQPFVQHHHAEVAGNRVTIQVTEAHLKLLRAANTNIVDEGGRNFGVEIDPKRPYGDMTFFEVDIAKILGIVADGPPSAEHPGERDFSAPQLQHFEELHEQMEPVLQVFLIRARLGPGHFVRIPRGYGRWSRT
jgi:hypothetical protein